MIGASAAISPTWHDRAALLAAIGSIAVTAWLVPASIHVVSWPSSGPVRLALMSPTWQLLVWLTAALVVTVALVVTGRTAPALRIVRPFLVLWALVIPYLPWLPDRLPLLLVLAGPLHWAIIAAAVAHAFLNWPIARQAVTGVVRLGRRSVFGASLAFYVLFGLWSVTTNGIGGDEPHYLVITESLLRDGDLQIENNHQRGDYRAFFRGDLRPDYMQRGKNGQIYSIHAPGLPVLLLPIYAVAGYLGAAVSIALIAAATALAVFDVAALLAGPRAAVLTWLAVCLTVPFVPHSWAIFPEMPGALLAAWATLWLVQRSDDVTPMRWVLRGVALALLPWLHTKFIVLLAIFSAGLGLRLLSRPRKLAALAAPIAASCALWLFSFYVLYGRFDPEAPYGAYTSVYVLTSNIPHGLLGLFFDQKFGLLVYSPVYLFVIAGLWVGMRDPRFRFMTLILGAVIAAFVASTARLYMFWGGSSAPARFFVPILPCLAPFIAMAIARYRSAVSDALLGLWLTVSLGVALVGILEPARLRLFSDPHGRARVLELLQGGSPLALVTPTFTEPDWITQIAPLALWLTAAGVAMVALLALRRMSGASAWTLAAAGTGTFLVVAAIATARPSAEVREATANRGDLDALWRYDSGVFRTLDYATLSRTTPERFRELTTLHIRPVVPGDARGPFETPPLNLPPGRFDAAVWFGSAAARSGEILVAEPRATFGAVSGTLNNPARFEITVPGATRRLQIRVPDLQVARAISEIQVVPTDVIPAGWRDPRPVRLIESVPGRDAAYLVYTDGEAYPEMGTFWTRGTAATTVLVVPGGASRMVLTLSTGPRSGVVKVVFGGRSEQLTSTANQEETMTFELQPDQRAVALTVQSSVMFRPAEVSPESRDMRGLGSRVRVALE